MKQAQYNTGGQDGILTLAVLAENADGTLELGDAKGVLKVGVCPTCAEPELKVGYARIIDAKAAAAAAAVPAASDVGSDAGDDTDPANVVKGAKGKKQSAA